MKTLIIGAGPAGLTAAYELSNLGIDATILEADRVVGGISRTISQNNYRFDVGGHRFFSKVPMVNTLWSDMLGDDFLLRPRLSRIHYNGHFYDYPLKISSTLKKLGIAETLRIGLSYIKTKCHPSIPEETFEQWVSNRFGWRLYEIFFKTYTEKVWGMPCHEISAAWATQRIKNLSLLEILRNTFNQTGRCKDGKVITTLIEQFHYPRLGPGQMWETFESTLRDRQIETIHDQRVDRIIHHNGRVKALIAINGNGDRTEYATDQVISSMPLSELVNALDPPPPNEVLQAAAGLRYRDFITVVLMVNQAQVFPDNWIYIHSPEFKMGRIQNYKNWSEDMVPDPATTSLGLEYFVSEHEEMWSWSDEQLIELGIKECEQLGFIKPPDIENGTVFRMKKAYPVYDQTRTANIDIIRRYLEHLPNLQAVGRNGQHHYNNMDHSMLTGIYAAQNISGETHDIWSVNVEQTYHERIVPERLPKKAGETIDTSPTQEQGLPDALATALAKLDPIALGWAVGIACGLGLFTATIVLLLKGGVTIGPRLSLLRYFLIGYHVSWVGAWVGFFDAAVLGYAIGFLCAWLHNQILHGYIHLICNLAEWKQRRDILQ